MSRVSPIAKLGLILLLVEPRKLLANPNSLDFSLIVKSQSTSHHPWCAVTGSVNTEPFLLYDSRNKTATPVGLGKKVHNTKEWKDVPQTLIDVCQKLREFLLGHLPRGHCTLQANMSCHLDAGVRTGASWVFSINGQTASIDTLHMNWTDTGLADMKIKEEWENNHELRKSLQSISTGDCFDWLKTFLISWEKLMERAAPQSEDSVTHPPTSSAASFVGNFPRITILVIICSVLMKYLL